MPESANHICPLHAEVTARSHLSGSVMIGITQHTLHWTIVPLTLSLPQRQNKQGWKRSKWTRIWDREIYITVMTSFETYYWFYLHQRSFLNPTTNANIISFFPLLSTSQTQPFSSQPHKLIHRILMDLFKGKWSRSSRGLRLKVTQAGERLSQWAELSDSSLIHELTTHSCFIWYRGKCQQKISFQYFYIL